MFRGFQRPDQAGDLVIPVEYQDVPPAMAESSAAWQRASDMEMPHAPMGRPMSGWSRIYGAVMLDWSCT